MLSVLLKHQSQSCFVVNFLHLTRRYFLKKKNVLTNGNVNKCKKPKQYKVFLIYFNFIQEKERAILNIRSRKQT